MDKIAHLEVFQKDPMTVNVKGAVLDELGNQVDIDYDAPAAMVAVVLNTARQMGAMV